MAKWKVINAHPQGLTHREMFRGDLIEIPAGGYVLMDYEDAIQFKSQYYPMKINAMDEPDPSGFKCIKIESDGIEEVVKTPEKTVYVCHFDKKTFSTLEALEAHVNTNYADKLVKDLELDKEIEKQNSRGKR